MHASESAAQFQKHASGMRRGHCLACARLEGRRPAFKAACPPPPYQDPAVAAAPCAISNSEAPGVWGLHCQAGARGPVWSESGSDGPLTASGLTS